MVTTINIKNGLYRVVDANLNRLKEGIRVIEDINRYIYNNKDISIPLKELRHLCIVDDYEAIIEHRDSTNDIFKSIDPLEMKRGDVLSVLIANFKRSQESARVLEEVYKIVNPTLCENFKKIRFRLYNLEQENILNFKK